jgi:hypothetical protein
MSRLREGWGALAVTAVVAAIVAQGAAAVPAPVADYQFHDNRSSSVPGAPQIADLGSGNAFATEDVAGCRTRAITFPQHNGLSLDTSGLRIGPTFSETVVIDFHLADVSSYRRLIQSADTTSHSGLYIRFGRLDWYDAGTGSHEGGPVIAPGADVEVALVQNAILSKWIMTGYVNGVEQFSFTSDFEVGPQLRLFKDNDPPGASGEDSAGAVFRVRFYNGSVFPSDIPAIYNASLLGNPSLCPAASASATGKPRALKTAHGPVIKTGVVASCPDTGVLCTGTASVVAAGAKKARRGPALASMNLAVAPGDTQAISVAMGKRGTKILRKRRKLRVTASVSITGPNGKPVPVATAGKIKQPAGK